MPIVIEGVVEIFNPYDFILVSKNYNKTVGQMIYEYLVILCLFTWL